MDKKPLIEVSILAVVLLVLGSLSNVVGYQTVQTSQQNLITERINQRELLFQTIVDIANNKEIQRIILKSQMSRGIFPSSEMPVLTKNQLKRMYFIGVVLSKAISKSKIQSMIGKYQLNNPELQKEISAVIDKDATIKVEISQLQNADCDCENGKKNDWPFPLLCVVLWSIFAVGVSLGYYFVIGQVIIIVTFILINIFRCMIYP
ncbi:MAG TPA: hypothetical protein ENO12_00365 [Thermoplasmatales archaeon]|nr:hypothetical protein [Thermoplasmatales archaeon]